MLISTRKLCLITFHEESKKMKYWLVVLPLFFSAIVKAQTFEDCHAKLNDWVFQQNLCANHKKYSESHFFESVGFSSQKHHHLFSDRTRQEWIEADLSRLNERLSLDIKALQKIEDFKNAIRRAVGLGWEDVSRRMGYNVFPLDQKPLKTIISYSLRPGESLESFSQTSGINPSLNDGAYTCFSGASACENTVSAVGGGARPLSSTLGSLRYTSPDNVVIMRVDCSGQGFRDLVVICPFSKQDKKRKVTSAPDESDENAYMKSAKKGWMRLQ